MTIKQGLVAAIVLACFSNTVFAGDEGGYAGVGAGPSFTTIKSSSAGESQSYNSTAFTFLGGYQFSQNFAVEAGYVDLGKISNNTSLSIAYSGFGVSGVGIMPLTNAFSLYGKVGVATINSTMTALPGYYLLVPSSESKTGVSFGLGAQYKMTPSVILRLSLDSYEASAAAGALTGRMGMYSAAVIFKF